MNGNDTDDGTIFRRECPGISPEFLKVEDGHVVGQLPAEILDGDWEKHGHSKHSLLTVIRAQCLDCSGDAPSEVRRCTAANCALWPYRMNANPFRAEMSEERREAASVRLKALRAKTA